MSLQMVPLCHSLFILEVIFALLKCMQSRHLAVGVKYQEFRASVPWLILYVAKDLLTTF